MTTPYEANEDYRPVNPGRNASPAEQLAYAQYDDARLNKRIEALEAEIAQKMPRVLQGEHGPIPSRVNCLNCGRSWYGCRIVNVSDQRCCVTCDQYPSATHPQVVVDTSEYDAIVKKLIGEETSRSKRS